MFAVLKALDRNGKKVYLTKKRYDHIKKHPEMQNSLSMIEETISNPQLAKDCVFDRRTHYYYRYYKNRKSKARYLRVIVQYLNGEGIVITAFFVVVP